MQAITAAEIASQPDLWPRAAQLAVDAADVLPARGARTCVVGCGTSLFIAQSWAALRERAGHGQTDAFAASELPEGRRYDVLVAISRSGSTSEVVHALGRDIAQRTVAITADRDATVARTADDAIELDFADEQSVVQTRFATTALVLLRELVQPGAAEGAAADARRALERPLPVDPEAVEQWTFLGRGWTVGLAQEAALKLRESAQAWTEAYPMFEYRHGPISIAAPGRVVWSLDPLDPSLAAELERIGATVVTDELDPLASLVTAQRTAVALATARGLDPDRPRNLARSVILADHDLEVLS
jgi:fructoselysine-6-P-deglycase FrlB-like protein